MLVDDEASILKALKKELRGWSRERSVDIKTCMSAKEGLDVLSDPASGVSVVVADLKMPGMRGIDFLLEVKRLYPLIVGLLLTGFFEIENAQKAAEADIFCYLMKPWDTEVLIAELDKALQASRTISGFRGG